MKRLSVVTAAAMLAPALSMSVQAQPDWVEESNQNAQVVLESFARFAPEGAGRLGVDGLDEEVLDLRPRIFERGIFAAEQALAELESRRGKSSHQAVEQDLEILITAVKDGIHTANLQQEYMLGYIDAPQTVYNGIQALIDPRIPAERQAAAVVRLSKYAGLAEGSEPLAKLAVDRTSERFSEEGLVGPYVAEVEEGVNNAQRYIDGTRALFEESELEGWEESFAVLEEQLTEYNDWVREEILPRARTEHRLPAPLYADNLRNVGVDIDPEMLMQRALTGFMEIRNEMNAIAGMIAAERGWDSGDYRDVIRELKKEQFEGEAVLPFFQERLVQIEEIIRREGIVTLPDREAVIRLATEAETARQPAPHVSPPRLIGNTGEPAEFVLPLVVPAGEGESNLPYDDFTFDAAAWTLTVHEARPGHELQFASMVEKGVSTARIVFAFNSVNVEGWALYAEAEMKPYLPLEGQLISLQHRLMRATRAFVDPMVNLGRMTPEEARAFLMKEVVLSEAMAKQEVDRYTFRLPGQATSYFYGYMRWMEMRAKAEIALGDAFDRMAFHDFVLSQGLLPPDVMQQAVLNIFVPSQLN